MESKEENPVAARDTGGCSCWDSPGGGHHRSCDDHWHSRMGRSQGEDTRPFGIKRQTHLSASVIHCHCPMTDEPHLSSTAAQITPITICAEADVCGWSVLKRRVLMGVYVCSGATVW